MFPILLAAAPLAAAPPPGDCPKIERYVVTKNVARPRQLDQEPPADGYYTVYRTDRRGCAIPVKFKLAPRN